MHEHQRLERALLFQGLCGFSLGAAGSRVLATLRQSSHTPGLSESRALKCHPHQGHPEKCQQMLIWIPWWRAEPAFLCRAFSRTSLFSAAEQEQLRAMGQPGSAFCSDCRQTAETDTHATSWPAGLCSGNGGLVTDLCSLPTPAFLSALEPSPPTLGKRGRTRTYRAGSGLGALR